MKTVNIIIFLFLTSTVFAQVGTNGNDRKEEEDIITTCGHRIGWDWNSTLGTVVWNKSGRRIMHCVTID